MIKSGFQCMHDMFLTYYRTSNDKLNPNFIQDHQAQLDQVRKEKQPYISVSKAIAGLILNYIWKQIEHTVCYTIIRKSYQLGLGTEMGIS